MARYRRISTVIEAQQFWPTKKPWPLNVRESPRGGHDVWNALHGSWVRLSPGDMVRVDDPNDTYPIALDTFTATYEPIE